jgi:hypothetical protein
MFKEESAAMAQGFSPRPALNAILLVSAIAIPAAMIPGPALGDYNVKLPQIQIRPSLPLTNEGWRAIRKAVG